MKMSNVFSLLKFLVLSFLVTFTQSAYAGAEEADEKPSQSSEQKSEEDPNIKTGTDKEVETRPGESEQNKKETAPPRIGNFSVPPSQQPAALFGFGGNIINKGEVQLYFFADEFVGKSKFVSDLIPSVLFGITDDWSVFFNAPFTPLMRDHNHRSSGFEDFFIQFEYAFYNKKTIIYEEQATLVANVTYPTGSVTKTPPTGFGSPSLFLGATFYRTLVDWIFFTSDGGVFTTSNHGTKIGEQFLYQCGIGRNIPSPEGWVFAGMLELDGQYNKKNRIRGDIDPNSGGNFIYITPSLWVSSKDVLVQFGVSFPINQNLFGDQPKIDYALNFNCAWSFYQDK